MISQEEFHESDAKELLQQSDKSATNQKYASENRFEGNLFKNITDIGQATIYLHIKNQVVRESGMHTGEFIDSVVKKLRHNKIQRYSISKVKSSS